LTEKKISDTVKIHLLFIYTDMSEKIQYLVSNVKETTVGGRKILAGGKETIALKEALMNHSGARAAITKESRDRVIGLANEGKWT
jgi:hypothetical protein